MRGERGVICAGVNRCPLATTSGPIGGQFAHLHVSAKPYCPHGYALKYPQALSWRRANSEFRSEQDRAVQRSVEGNRPEDLGPSRGDDLCGHE